MSLKYSVVVIDDKKLLFEDYKRTINDFLSRNGFFAEVEHIPSEKAFYEYPLGKADLFLVDLKFGQDDKGQTFIEAIRDDNLTDVLFYSSDHEAIEKYRVDLGSQGIFFAERDEQNDEVEPLLNKMLAKMITKSNAPRATRGLVMECVAELDDKIKEKILLLIEKLPKEKHDSCYKKILKIIKCSLNGRINKLHDFFNVDFAKKLESTVIDGINLDFSLNDLIENIQITDSDKNLRYLLTIYEDIYGKNELYHKIESYSTLLKKRNILAHVSQIKAQEGYIFKSRNTGMEDYILTDEESLSLRQNILSLEKILNEIE
ncbi:MAG: hypothetical protein IKL18_08315 [Oscillospiraceae bacterium]|nr:hypothetical protein [Oscillospiraceae bacterium]